MRRCRISSQRPNAELDTSSCLTYQLPPLAQLLSLPALQGNHGSTGGHSHDGVQADGKVTNAEEGLDGHGGGQGAGFAGGAGSRRAGSTCGGGLDGVGGTGAGELGLAARVRAGLLGGGRAIEVTGARIRVLGLVVLVENVAQLLLGAAHGVCTVETLGGVGGDASAQVTVVQAADVAEDVTVGSVVQGGGSNASQRLEHAVAQVRVGRGRQGRGSLPGGTNNGTSGGRVGGRVRGHGSAGGGGSVDTRAQRAVGLEGRDTLGVDSADQTWIAVSVRITGTLVPSG